MYPKMPFKTFAKLLTVLLAGPLLLAACAPVAMETHPPANPTTTAAGEMALTVVSPTPLPATAISTAQPSANTGTAITFGTLTLVVPSGVASGASSSEFARLDSEDAAWWQKTPGHLQVMLGDYYVLQGKFHEPQIYVYPAQAYAELVPPAFESLHRLNNILGVPGVPINAEQLPAIPFFNAQQVIATNIQPISFQNGEGIRFLTEYAQYTAPVNNQDLFYHFQGVTRDGNYYIIAIFPVTVPVLAETSDIAETLPSGGVAAPDLNDPSADWQSYYAAVADLLNNTSLEAFTPSINQLDLLIQSMEIAS